MCVAVLFEINGEGGREVKTGVREGGREVREARSKWWWLRLERVEVRNKSTEIWIGNSSSTLASIPSKVRKPDNLTINTNQQPF